MKKIGLKLALVAVLFAAGTLGTQAQVGLGGDCLGTGTAFTGTTSGSCIYTQLTEEQKAILHDLFVAYRAEMDVLRAEARATRDFAVKREIWVKMKELRLAHLAEVKALLTEWGIGG